ncbi:DUF418 domain-containing protein [Gemmatimonas sp.]|uniref:DUF418 domain-containing protein n=1 Tax=Gemmatimonas sp. TaxID=1962908 RepID=UPI0035613404
MSSVTAAPSLPRDDAIDLARAVAILGMFVIHAVLALATSVPNYGLPGFILWWCDGRAAATFVTLAGFGMARLASRSDGASTATLRKRALVLWTMGVINLVVWPGDILRVYGVALLLAPLILRWSVRTRVWVSVALGVAFRLLMLVFDWAKHWQLDTLTYVGVWTVDGFVRNLLFDGFRPVVPWLAFFVMGTVLAEQHLRDTQVHRWLLRVGVLTTLSSLGLSVALDRLLGQLAPQVDALTREGLVGTTSLPPLPLFLLSAVGTTSLVLGSAFMLVPHAPRWVVEPLVATGRRAITWYVLHVALPVTLYSLAWRNSRTPAEAIAIGLAIFSAAVCWSFWRRTEPGLFESLVRRFTRTRFSIA